MSENNRLPDSARQVKLEPTDQSVKSASPEADFQTHPAVIKREKKSPITLFLIAVLAVSTLFLANLWFKVSHLQETLARQSADASAISLEARTLARGAQDSAKDLLIRQSNMDVRLNEISMQRGQLEELMQNLSRSRDENLLVDMDSALRLAQQQTHLTGSLEPLIAALRSAQARVTRSAQPRLASLQRAISKDLDRVKSSNMADTPSLLVKFDEIIRLADDLPLANAVAAGLKQLPSSKSKTAQANIRQNMAEPGETASGISAYWPAWLREATAGLRSDLSRLVRVSRVDAPAAMFLSPEQSFFLRENLKLKLLNARLALLSRQMDICRSDLSGASEIVEQYFDPASPSQSSVLEQLKSMQAQLKTTEQPKIDDSLAAIQLLSAGGLGGKL